jgi:uroporphyrinogen decarboxylase
LADTGYDCIEKALKGCSCSRIPCFPLIDAAFASAYGGYSLREVQTDPEKHAEALERCARELPVDGVYINLSLSREQVVSGDAAKVIIDEAVTISVPENDVLSIAETSLTDLDDPRITEAALFHPGMLETYRLVSQDIKEEYAVVTGLTGTFSQLAFLFGVQDLLIELLDRPKQVRRALEHRHVTVMEQVDEFCDAGVRFAWIGEGLGSGSLISPEQYREFVLPYEQEIARMFRERGVLTLLHICGNIRNSLDFIAQSGVDGIDLDYPVPVEAAFNALGPETSVKGNINPGLFLPGHAAELTEACRSLLKRADGQPGFIMSTGCLVPRDSTEEAFHIMRTECNNYTKESKNG